MSKQIRLGNLVRGRPTVRPRLFELNFGLSRGKRKAFHFNLCSSFNTEIEPRFCQNSCLFFFFLKVPSSTEKGAVWLGQIPKSRNLVDHRDARPLTFFLLYLYNHHSTQRERSSGTDMRLRADEKKEWLQKSFAIASDNMIYLFFLHVLSQAKLGLAEQIPTNTSQREILMKTGKICDTSRNIAKDMNNYFSVTGKIDFLVSFNPALPSLPLPHTPLIPRGHTLLYKATTAGLPIRRKPSTKKPRMDNKAANRR